MTPLEDVARFRRNRQKDIDSTAIAQVEKAQELTEVHRRLTASEETRMQFWEGNLRDAGVGVPHRRLGGNRGAPGVTRAEKKTRGPARPDHGWKEVGGSYSILGVKAR